MDTGAGFPFFVISDVILGQILIAFDHIWYAFNWILNIKDNIVGLLTERMADDENEGGPKLQLNCRRD